MQGFLRSVQAVLMDQAFAGLFGFGKSKLEQALGADEEWQAQVEQLATALPVEIDDVVAFVQAYFLRLHIDLPSERWAEDVYDIATHQLFPENFSDRPTLKIKKCAEITLDVVALFLLYEKEHTERLGLLTFDLLTAEEVQASPNATEYRRLLDSWNEHYIQEILRIGRTTSYFDLLSHIAGVYEVAVTVGRQMRARGVPVDLCLLAGAALVHDIGKFGCRDEQEVHRMAYLHYYYTDVWCSKHGLHEIGHIAMNHSTWDLELESLSVESLALIYADFRVKARTDLPRGKREVMHIYSLEESFEVILNKLDNVDEKKRQRYVRVYNKLADFETYMRSLGVNVSIRDKEMYPAEPIYMGILAAAASPRVYKNLAFAHNIRIMHTLSNADYLTMMLEQLRANDSSVDIRANLNVFEEYFTYMTKTQKEMILRYLREMLIHSEGDIRRQAAKLIGLIIAGYDKQYSKELPQSVLLEQPKITGVSLWKEVLVTVFEPSVKMGIRYRRWMGYAVQIVLKAILEHCVPYERADYLEPLFSYYRDTGHDDLTIFLLLNALQDLPLDLPTDADRQRLLTFALQVYDTSDIEIRTAALLFIERYAEQCAPDAAVCAHIVSVLRAARPDRPSVCYLYNRIMTILAADDRDILCHYDMRTADIFLANLKSSTAWITKIVNIRRLAEALETDPTINRLHIALHFSNLLKVSEQVAVRHDAGQVLVQVAPLLTTEEINEVVVELTRGLEMDSFEFTKYIPEYLARLSLLLYPKELDEVIETIGSLVDSSHEASAELALDMLAHVMALYEGYSARVGESEDVSQARLVRLCGIILKGLASYRLPVHVETLSILGKIIFGSPVLQLESKFNIFNNMYKRLLMQVIEEEGDDRLLFYGNSTALNHIYRFIADHDFFRGEMPLEEHDRVAFFPGTFDPFTLGHKGIVQRIRDLGFDVYVAVDEFSWSKNIQPARIRRKILQMSLADEIDVYIFPPVFPVNIANQKDIRKLSEIFKGKELYLVVGSDVVVHASAYAGAPEDDSVHQLNHILVDRPEGSAQYSSALTQCRDIVQGKIIELTLPQHLEHISSTSIRENISYHREISHLIDKMAQNYIYENNLYLGEPKMKPVLNPLPHQVNLVDTEEGAFWSHLGAFFSSEADNPLAFLANGTSGKSRLVMIQEAQAIEAVALVQIVGTMELYGVFQHRDIAKHLRQLGSSTMAVVSDLKVHGHSQHDALAQEAMSEAFLWAMEQLATYCVYHCKSRQERVHLDVFLRRQGFVPLDISDDESSFYIVNMRAPFLLSDNVATRLKEPYRSHPKVQAAIHEAHVRLQTALKDFKPGHLVLSYNAMLLQQKMARLVTDDNGVPAVQGGARQIGDKLCVPVNHLLRNVVVPNTATRPLFVQNVYAPDMERASIGPMPYHDSLANQVRIIRSFDRPVILTDETFRRGRVFAQIVPLMERAGITIDSVDVGLLSGDGRDMLIEHGYRYRYVHFIPNQNHLFIDSKGYPFIDGQSQEGRAGLIKSGLQHTVIPLLPYAASTMYRHMKVEDAYTYSMVSMQNALTLMKTLEDVYQQNNERSLTLNRLPEVIVDPVFPDLGAGIAYDFTRNPSLYIEESIMRLRYFENLRYVRNP